MTREKCSLTLWLLEFAPVLGDDRSDLAQVAEEAPEHLVDPLLLVEGGVAEGAQLRVDGVELSLLLGQLVADLQDESTFR